MSRRDDPYIELYWRLADEYPQVWDDDRGLAWYVRLLKAADAAWPSAADIPAAIPARSWRLLVDSGLVLPEAGGRRYRIRGLDKKRDARRSAAGNASRTRWGSADGDADRNASRIPDRTPDRSPDGNATRIPGRNADGNPPQHSTAQHSREEYDFGNTTPPGVTTRASLTGGGARK